MAASLAGCYAKLERAVEHLAVFEREGDQALRRAATTTTFGVRYDPAVPRFMVEVIDEPDLPSRLSTIAGDLIHNLRSCLDHLAYQLLVLAGDEWDKTQWPIVTDLSMIDASGRFKGLRDRLIAAGRSDLWSTVESFQLHTYLPTVPPPGVWEGTQRLRDLPLLVLHELSNYDKHRLLIEPFIGVDHYNRIEPRCIADCVDPKLMEKSVWFTLRKAFMPIAQFTATITGPNPEMEVDVDFQARPVEFLEISGTPATDYLELMTDAVRDVLTSFTPAFP